MWIGGVDNSSQVVFNLFRDSKKIYTGSKSNYVDKEVEYPNVYEYYIEAVDEANNYVKRNSVEEIPKKVKINFEINLKKDQKVTNSNFTINMKVEENSNLSLFIKNQKSILYEKSFDNTTGNIINVEVMFEEGINEIDIEIFDDFNNTLKQTYFVTYEIPEVISEKVVEEAVISEKTSDVYKVTINENITNILVPDKAQKMAQDIVSDISSIFMTEEEKVVEEPVLSYAKVGLFLIFIIFAVIIWNYLFNEDKLRQKVKDLRYIKENNNMAFFRKKDSSLSSSLEKIKEERTKKQVTKLIEDEKKKKVSTKIMTDYEKQKYSDISRRDRISDRIIGTDNRKIVEEKPKKETEFISETELMEKHEKKEVESKSNFFSWFEKKPKKEDSFLDYIQKEKVKKSWDSKSDFIFKEEKKPEPKAETKVEVKDNLSLDKNTPSQNNVKADEVKIKPEPAVEKEINSVNKKEIDRKHMLDDYLGKVISKRRSFFAEKEVNKDIFKRQEK